MAIRVERSEKMNSDPFDFTIEVTLRLVGLGDNLHIQSGRLLSNRQIQDPSTGMLVPDMFSFRMTERNGDVSEMKNPHGIPSEAGILVGIKCCPAGDPLGNGEKLFHEGRDA